MNILKRLEELKQFMASAVERAEGKPESVQRIVHDGLYYTLTLNSKIQTWIEEGQKTFILSKDLIDAFLHTDISLDMYPNDFHYPFRSFIIEGETPFFKTRTFDKRMEMKSQRWIDTILYVHVDAILAAPNVLSMSVDGKVGEVPDWQHSLTAPFPGTGQGLENIMMYMDERRTLKSSITERKRGTIMIPIAEEDARNIANIFFNAVLYINDPTRNPAETEQHGSRKMKISGKKSVRSQYILIRPPRTYKPLYSKSGRTLDKRFIVRGHWRNQAYGAKMSEHKRIWIYPYWKGPELSEIVSRPYVISK